MIFAPGQCFNKFTMPCSVSCGSDTSSQVVKVFAETKSDCTGEPSANYTTNQCTDYFFPGPDHKWRFACVDIPDTEVLREDYFTSSNCTVAAPFPNYYRLTLCVLLFPGALQSAKHEKSSSGEVIRVNYNNTNCDGSDIVETTRFNLTTCDDGVVRTLITVSDLSDSAGVNNQYISGFILALMLTIMMAVVA